MSKLLAIGLVVYCVWWVARREGRNPGHDGGGWEDACGQWLLEMEVIEDRRDRITAEAEREDREWREMFP